MWLKILGGLWCTGFLNKQIITGGFFSHGGFLYRFIRCFDRHFDFHFHFRFDQISQSTSQAAVGILFVFVLAEFGRLVDFQIHLKRAVMGQSSTPESYNDLILISVTVETFDEVEVNFAVASACACHQQ